MLLGVRAAFSTAWRWLRPRTVPVVFAALGAVFVIASAEYLSHGHGTLPRSATSVTVSTTISTP
jgi:hypothetical protein